jgi:uncharacterized membrane protein YeaQ/YmgE (transglycosylase-associated protein family)
MGIIAFLVLGLLAGAIARALVPGEQSGGIFITMLLGVVGAVGAGLLAGVIFDVNPIDEFFDVSTWVAAIIGAVVVVAIYEAIVGRSGSRDRTLGR